MMPPAVLVWRFILLQSLIIDALSGNGDISGPYTSAPKEFDTSDRIYLYLEPDGTPLRNGKFEATATINVSYY